MNFSLCGNFNFSWAFGNCKSKTSMADEILSELQDLLDNPHFDNSYIFIHILNKLIQVSGSEYGFISTPQRRVIHGEEKTVLKLLSLTNIAWNKASFEFYKHFINEEAIHENICSTLYGDVFSGKKVINIRKYKDERNVLPSGHPPIKNFLGIPVIVNDTVIYVIGLCNKRKHFTKQDIKTIEKITLILKLISLDGMSGDEMSIVS